MRAALAGLAVACAGAGAQQLGSLEAPVPGHAKQYVAFIAEPATIAAGRRAVLELHFQVAPEFHINSHQPKSDLLIATAVELAPAAGVKAAAAEYPAGTPLSFAFDPAEKLDVYQGDFAVRVPVVASAGAHELKGTLHYQACNRAACYPVKDLPINVVFNAK